VGAILQYLNLSLWSAMLHASVHDLGSAVFWVAVLQLIFINILVSGDNAVVIALACRDLPPRQRLWGMVIGAGIAVILRIVFAGLIARLMLLPYLKLAGGLALIYIAARLVVPEAADKNKIQSVAHLWRAVRIVVLADVVMSLDNVIAIAAVAHGQLVLLAIGLVVSVPIIVAGSALIMALLDRFPIFVWAGAALLGWVAGDTVAADPVVAGHLTATVGAEFARQVEFAAAGAGILLVVALGGLWRQIRVIKVRARPAGEHAGGS
jgi:YjbE family integral membrane protein